jgi:hypothetical protein
MTQYKAVLFAPDGDWVTDYAGSASVEEVQELVADQGSRWYFYPFSAVTVDHGALTTASQRLVDVCHSRPRGRALFAARVEGQGVAVVARPR